MDERAIFCVTVDGREVNSRRMHGKCTALMPFDGAATVASADNKNNLALSFTGSVLGRE